LEEKKKYKRDPRSAKNNSRYKRIKSLLNAGYSIEEIYKLCSWKNNETDELVKKINEHIINQEKRKLTMLDYRIESKWELWHKDDYYYHPLLYSEEELVNLPPIYTYSDLSKDEKEIYDVSNFIDGDWKAKQITIQLYKCGFYQDEKPDPLIEFYELHSKRKK
jgi:hypothetical protein